MSGYFYLFLIILLAGAMLAGPAGSFVFIVFYLLAGVFLLGRLWSRKSLAALEARRVFNQNAFLGEDLSVQLEIHNRSLLPVVWLVLQESLPPELSAPGTVRRVISLHPRQKFSLAYPLKGRRRGYYPLGPLHMNTGDLLGFEPDQQRILPTDYLTVFPKIIQLSRVSLPSHSPMGTLRHTQPLYEDPTRVLGKRDYVTGDSLRRVDWKATASTNRLQVKIFEPSISLEAAIFLNLNWDEYPMRNRYDVAELAITVAASLANWLITRRQSAGLYTNGGDPMENGAPSLPLPPRRGRAQLMHILQTLGRVQFTATFPLVQLIQNQSIHLAWGSSLLVISPQVEDALFDQLFEARRSGLSPVIILCGQTGTTRETRQKALSFGFPAYLINSESDLDIWRR